MTAVAGSDWLLHADAQALVDGIVDAALARSPGAAAVVQSICAATSTRPQDWLDHVAAPVGQDDLRAAGFVDGYRTTPGLWRHPGAQLPAVAVAQKWELALRVDDAAAFAQAQRCTAAIDGSPLSGFRRVVVAGGDVAGGNMTGGDDVTVSGVERRSWAQGLTTHVFDSRQTAAAAQAWQVLAERPRALTGADGVRAQLTVARRAVELVGADLAASYFLQLERRYWQRSNTAGLVQFGRQDRAGMGWGNNDHHTFRSSRPAFAPLITVLAALGFEMREQFYAGAEAGWGAQVIEHPGCGGVIFADVDLTPDEIAIDFAHTELFDDLAGAGYGTVGLWCALHGESVLEAGMHHLEGQFEFDALRTELAALGVETMAPFSNFDHLRQAFTQAERWAVPTDRVEKLVADGQLTPERGAEIIAEGAPGSHLENLARRDGFKGFNQHNVSTTMRATDPRSYRPI